jgi:hypothetical protein
MRKTLIGAGIAWLIMGGAAGIANGLLTGRWWLLPIILIGGPVFLFLLVLAIVAMSDD